MIRSIFAAAILLSLFASHAFCAIPGPAEIVEIHLDRIAASDFPGAEKLFSDAFRAAILSNVRLVNVYLLGRKEALAESGYSLEEPSILEEGRFALVQAQFENDQVFYYLIRESSGWRIEAFSDVRYSTFAEGRRGLYLFTSRDWNDTGSKELKCRANLFLIQQALEDYFDGKGKGSYPGRLSGGDGTDALVTWGYIPYETGYPQNYFSRKPMRNVRLDKPEPGDFTYIPVDRESDGVFESYYLLGWGTPGSEYSLFDEIEIVGFLASADDRANDEAMADFIEYARSRFGVVLTPTEQSVRGNIGAS
ncbi:MAG: hypothetical protein HRF49_04955 [bacterium]